MYIRVLTFDKRNRLDPLRLQESVFEISPTFYKGIQSVSVVWTDSKFNGQKEKYRKRKMALAHARYGERKGVSILKRKWEERAKWNKKAIRDTRNHTWINDCWTEICFDRSRSDEEKKRQRQRERERKFWFDRKREREREREKETQEYWTQLCTRINGYKDDNYTENNK